MDEQYKICIKCKISKTINNFEIKNKEKKVTRNKCKKCISIDRTNRRLKMKENDPEKYKEFCKRNCEVTKKHYEKNKKVILKKEKDKRNENIEEFRKNKRQYYKKNVERDKPKRRIRDRINRRKPKARYTMAILIAKKEILIFYYHLMNIKN